MKESNRTPIDGEELDGPDYMISGLELWISKDGLYHHSSVSPAVSSYNNTSKNIRNNIIVPVLHPQIISQNKTFYFCVARLFSVSIFGIEQLQLP
jgi:hypothetical protein